jgi:predicted nucleic acid-binding protein
MSQYVLDTDMMDLFEGRPPDITVEEKLSGWYTQLRQAKTPDRLAWAYRRLAATVRFLARISIADFDEPAIQRYQELRKLKRKMRKMDLRIAATVPSLRAICAISNRFPDCASRIGPSEPCRHATNRSSHDDHHRRRRLGQQHERPVQGVRRRPRAEGAQRTCQGEIQSVGVYDAAPGQPGGCPPGFPRIRTCPIQAYGSSCRGWADATVPPSRTRSRSKSRK